MVVLDDGVQITLTGKDSDTLFVWAIAMLLCAVAVAVVCMTMPVPYAIGAVALWAVAMYFFNQKKHAAKTQKRYAQGALTIKNHQVNINGLVINLSQDAKIVANNEHLMIQDKGMTHYFTGFADVNEIQIAKAVLGGQKIAKREKMISMASY